MLNHKTTLLLAISCLLIAVVVNFFRPVHGLVYAAISLAAISLYVYGSIAIRSGFYVKALCSVKSLEKKIAISFDDGPDPETTTAVLDILLKNRIQAVFFCVGNKITENQSIVKRMDAEGHLIGNHSHSHHILFDLFSLKRMRRELEQTGNAIVQITGIRTKLFRPPYGVTNPTVARVVRLLDYIVIGWSLRSKDTVIQNEQTLLSRLKKKLKSGDIVLFHDTGNHIVHVLQAFIDFATQHDYKIVRIDKLLNIQAYA